MSIVEVKPIKAPIVKVPIYEWLCPCGEWIIDRCIQHGYWEQSDKLDLRQIGGFEITLSSWGRRAKA